jgi:hypothetical protein
MTHTPETEHDDVSRVQQMIMSFRLTRLLHAAATLGLADLLKDEPRSAQELSAQCDAHPGSLYRLLRALASIGILAEMPDHRFTLTVTGQCLRSDAQPSLRDLAVIYGEPWMWNTYGELLHSIRTGQSAFEHVHGTSLFQYLAANASAAARFNAAMTALSAQENAALLAAYDFSRYCTVVDVGGGHGRLLGAILGANTHVAGVLFDLPAVVTGARALLSELAVIDRCTIVAGNFFEFVPPGGDLYVLKSIVHNWNRQQAESLLRNCRAAVPPHGRLLLIERVIGAIDEASEAKLFDIAMLALLGGQERTAEEYAELLRATGFQLRRVFPSRSPHSIVEAVPIESRAG